jgi:hypothetical protein
MSNGGPRDLHHATESEKVLATALVALAGAILAGLLAALPAMLAGLNESGARCATIISALILALLGLSIVVGGRGYAYGPGRDGWSDRFNLQAVFGAMSLILILVLAGVIYATTEPSAGEKLAAKQTELETRFVDVKKDVDAISRDVATLNNDLAGLKNGAVDLPNRLRKIDDSLKSLSDRTEKLEQPANQVKP